MTQLEAQQANPAPVNSIPANPTPANTASKPHPGEPLPGEHCPRPFPASRFRASRSGRAHAGRGPFFFAARLAGSWVPAYLAGRGFGEQVLRPWTVGYAPAGWRVLTAHLRDLATATQTIQPPGWPGGPGGPACRLLQGPAMFGSAAGWTVAGFTGRAALAEAGRASTSTAADRPVPQGQPAVRLYEGRRALAAGARRYRSRARWTPIAVSRRPLVRGRLALRHPLTPAQVTLLAGTAICAGRCGLAFDADRRAAGPGAAPITCSAA
jgi:hypothetical protein